MTDDDIHAFGVEIVCKQLEQGGWLIETVEVFSDRESEPQIIATKEGETGFFVVRTAMYPKRGQIEGQATFDNLVKHAESHGAACYFASVGIANSRGTGDEDMATPVKGVAYHVAFDGLVKMELPPSGSS